MTPFHSTVPTASPTKAKITLGASSFISMNRYKDPIISIEFQIIRRNSAKK